MIEFSLSDIQAFVHPTYEGKAPKQADKVLGSFKWGETVFIDSPQLLNYILCVLKRPVVFGKWDIDQWLADGRKGTPRKNEYFLGSTRSHLTLTKGFQTFQTYRQGKHGQG